MDIRYFDSKYAILIHDMIIETSGGLPGIKDNGRLESILEHLKNDIYYPTFESKLSRLVFTVIQFHMFNDGNKRSSISLGTFFLNINDYSHCSDTFIEEMENIVLWVAQGLIKEDLLEEIIKSIVTNNALSEDVKVKIVALFLNSRDS